MFFKRKGRESSETIFKGGGREEEKVLRELVVLLTGSMCGQYTDHFYINRLSNIQIGQTTNRVSIKKLTYRTNKKARSQVLDLRWHLCV